MFFCVREGQRLGYNTGTVIDVAEPGTIVELPPRMKRELAEKVFPCTEDGTSLEHLTGDALEEYLAQPHERESLRAAVAARKFAKPELTPPEAPPIAIVSTPPAGDAPPKQ